MKKQTGLVTAALCLGITIFPATISFHTDSAQRENRFTCIGENGIEAVLTEPSWAPENGLLTLPGAVISKDPQITNTSQSDLDELVAVKMEFCYSESCPDVSKRGTLVSEADMVSISDIYDIDYNADLDGDWIRFEGEDSTDAVQHFYYREILERNYPGTGETTVPLFTELSISESTGNKEFQAIQNIGGFDIVLSGFALQHMPDETVFGLGSAEDAYHAGLFNFE